MWFDEAGEVLEMFRNSFPLSFLFFVPLLIIISPVNPVQGAHEFGVYRMQQYDLHGTAYGCRNSMVNMEARSLEAKMLTRRCVIARLREINMVKYRDLLTQNAGALLILLPQNVSTLAAEEKELLMGLERDLMSEETPLPVYFAHESLEVGQMYEEVKRASSSDQAATAVEALLGSALANGYQLVINGAQAKSMADFQIINIQGKLSGYGIEDQLPTVAIIAHYDSYGVAPGLSQGGDSNGSGVVMLLELARLFSKLYTNSRTHAKYNLVFLLAGGGKFNYQGTKKWIEDNLDSPENFKSLEVSKEKKEEDGEFEQQRQATIAEALQNQKVKTFGGMGKQLIQDKDVAKIVEIGFSSEEAMCALKQNQGNPELAINALLSRSVTGVGGQRGRGSQRPMPSQDRQERSERSDRPDRSDRSDRADSRQGGRGRRNAANKENEIEDLAPTRPSGPATLFDFLETKMTIKDDSKTETKEPSSKPASSRSEGQSYQGRSSTANSSKPQAASKYPDHRSQGQGFSQNRRQNLPPRLANKYNRDAAEMNSTRSSQQRSNSSYHSKQSDSSDRAQQSDRNSYTNKNSYGGSERNNYSDRNNYGSDSRNNYGSERNSGGSERNSYSGSDRNSNRDRSGRDRGFNYSSNGSDRSQGRTNAYRKPDFSNPPPTMAYDTGKSSQYSSGQYGYQAGNPTQSYRPNTVPYGSSYNNTGVQNDWGQTQDFQSDMSPQGYVQNNGQRGPREWRRGDKCLAQYSGDGQFYNAVIEALSRGLPTCVVTFTEYGNSEEVPLDSLRPVPKYTRTDGNWQGGSASKVYSTQPMKHHHHSGMVIPQGMAYAPPIAGDESLFAANHITTMEFRRGGGGNTYQKRPDRQGGGRNQPFYSSTGGQNPAPTSHY